MISLEIKSLKKQLCQATEYLYNMNWYIRRSGLGNIEVHESLQVSGLRRGGGGGMGVYIPNFLGEVDDLDKNVNNVDMIVFLYM